MTAGLGLNVTFLFLGASIAVDVVDRVRRGALSSVEAIGG